MVGRQSWPRPPADPERDLLLRAARSFYVFHRRAFEEGRTGQPCDFGARPVALWDGGVDHAGRHHKAVWPTLVDLCRSLQLSLPVYIESRFADPTVARPPGPADLLSKTAAADYSVYTSTAGRRARNDRDAQKNAFLLDVERYRCFYAKDTTDAARRVLCDRTLPYSPLFRVCMAHAGDATDIVECFQAAALYQLVRGFFRLTSGWGDFLPPSLLSDGEKIIAGLMAGRVED